MTNMEKSKRLEELLYQIEDAVKECKQIAGNDLSSKDFAWVRAIQDQLYGSLEPTIYRSILALRGEMEAL